MAEGCGCEAPGLSGDGASGWSAIFSILLEEFPTDSKSYPVKKKFNCFYRPDFFAGVAATRQNVSECV